MNALEAIRQATPTPDCFAASLLRLRNKDMELVPFVFNPVQRHLLARLTGRDLILKARQHGISSFVQALLFEANIKWTSASLTLSDTGENTSLIRSIAKRFWDLWPLDWKPPRDQDSAITVHYPLTDSHSLAYTAGAKTAGRGGTVSHFHGSEMAQWKSPEETFAGALQTCTPTARIFLESTPYGAQGKFYQMCMEALDGRSDWKLHFYPWWWADEYYDPLEPGEEIVFTPEEEAVAVQAAEMGFRLSPGQIKWRRRKRRELPHTFLQEYPEDPVSCFLASGTGFFGDLSGCWYEDPPTEPAEGHIYVAGIDWGQAEDWTVCSIGDVTTRRQVAVIRMRKLPWRVMRERIVDACQYWGVKRVLAEINSIGGVNFEALQQQNTSNFQALKEAVVDDQDRGEQLAVMTQAPPNIHWLPFVTTYQTKPGLVQSLYRGLHECGLKLIHNPLDPTQKMEFGAFRATQSPHTMKWSYAAAQGHHDDYVIAVALMWLLMERPAVGRIRTLE